MRWINLPNALTLSRLVLAPFAVRAIAHGDFRHALLLFALAAATDGMDGFLARRFDWKTRVGAYLDPIADKTLLVASYLALGLGNLAPWWIVWLVFGRDLLILAMAAAALAFTSFRDFPPSVWGKISTAIQAVTAAVLLVGAAFPDLSSRTAAEVMLWLVVAGTGWSGIDYVRRAICMVRRGSGMHQQHG